MARGAREVSKEAHGLAGIMRETAVLFREGFRGNFTRMIGSFTILAGTSARMPFPWLPAWRPSPNFCRARKEARPSRARWRNYSREKDQSGGRTPSSGRMTRLICSGKESKEGNVVEKAGLIDAKKGRGLFFRPQKPELATVDLIMGETNKLLPKGGQAALADLVEKQRLDAAHFKNISAINRDELSVLRSVG